MVTNIKAYGAVSKANETLGEMMLRNSVAEGDEHFNPKHSARRYRPDTFYTMNETHLRNSVSCDAARSIY